MTIEELCADIDKDMAAAMHYIRADETERRRIDEVDRFKQAACKKFGIDMDKLRDLHYRLSCPCAYLG